MFFSWWFISLLFLAVVLSPPLFMLILLPGLFVSGFCYFHEPLLSPVHILVCGIGTSLLPLAWCGLGALFEKLYLPGDHPPLAKLLPLLGTALVVHELAYGNLLLVFAELPHTGDPRLVFLGLGEVFSRMVRWLALGGITISLILFCWASLCHFCFPHRGALKKGAHQLGITPLGILVVALLVEQLSDMGIQALIVHP